MVKEILLGAVIALVTPAAVLAQQGTPTFNRSAVNTVLNRSEVKAAASSFKNLDGLRQKLIRAQGFQDGSACVVPVPIAATDVDMHRTLFVHDEATLNAGNFSLRRTLQKLSDDVAASVPGTSPESIFQQFMDTQNDATNQATAGNAHCSDDHGKVNGYPFNKCPRPEGIDASGTLTDIKNRIDNDYRPIALVNRLDLADKGWKNCGEHRVVYGKSGGTGKNLIIFEAVLPNPKPGCRSGCRDVIDFWLDLSDDVSPASRAAKLEQFYYTKLPGFQAVVDTRHYTSGTSSVYGGSSSGQIRMNQFLSRTGMVQGPWTLKEFKTFLSCTAGNCDYDILPSSVKVNPYGVLWSRDVATGMVPALPPDNSYANAITNLTALAKAFQAEVKVQVTAAKLANPDVNSITYEVKLDKNSAESQSQSPVIDDYPAQFAGSTNAGFRTDLDTLATGFGLTGAQIVNRAAANSCAGCHLPEGMGLTGANAIGPGVSWPHALKFVHVDTPPAISLIGQPDFDVTKFGGNAQGFNISPALLTAFLPARRTNLVDLANKKVCDCVPKPIVLIPRAGTAVINRQQRLLDASSRALKDELFAAHRRFIAKPELKAGDPRDFFLEQKAIIIRAEAARNAELEAAGLTLEQPAAEPKPVVLSAAAVPREKLMKLKMDKLREIVNAEPPRETITGSFRSH